MRPILNPSDYPIAPYIRLADFAVRSPWIVPERRLLDYLLIYIQEGYCVIPVEGVEHHFREGEFCLIQPNDRVLLQGTTNTITPFIHMDVFYNARREQSFTTLPHQLDLSAYRHLLQPRLNDFHNMQIPIKLQPSQPTRFRDTLLQTIGLWKQEGIISQLEAQQLATELILSILKDYYHTSPQKSQSPQSLNWITAYMTFHLSEPITVEALADRANLSTSRFSRVFREQFGQSPYHYLLRLRIRHAQELLASTSITLAQVAEHCGFADIHHFAKAFKRMTGETPGKYRKR